MFAFKSPLKKGVILADEVGLGKTIEAGLVICQYWSIGRRKLIVVGPASLRKQWSYELTEKFGLANEILDSKIYRDYKKNGKNPLSNNKILVCLYNFASKIKNDIKSHGFDLAVLDEAHKLRNVYKKGSKLSHNIKEAFNNTKKLLLTAIPFQNSLMELYGLYQNQKVYVPRMEGIDLLLYFLYHHSGRSFFLKTTKPIVKATIAIAAGNIIFVIQSFSENSTD